jgi:YVTN family beta-propeller protein
MPDDTVYKLAADGSVAGTHKVGYRPYGASLSPDGKLLAVSIWGGKSVELLDSSDLHEVANITVGEHPCEMTWSGDGKRLFVACAGGDNVAVIGGTGTWKVEEQLRVTPDPAGPRVGVTPDAVALSADGKRLYVAEAGANCVAVADTSSAGHSRVIGFIPTGWYPSAVAVSPDGRTLYVGVGKGLKSRPNVPALTTDGDTQPDGSGHQDYIGDCMAGAVSVVSLPDAAGLTDYSRQVVANIPRPSATDQADAALVAEGKAAFKKIHHVLYIIRENRTYDQVLGDLKQGNGDPGLVLFGANVTPNAHRLASDGVLLDNCYCDGEVSEDGHEWCNGAYATDFKEKAYVNSYSDRGEPPSDVRLSESPAGYLWDDCRKKGVSYFSYGEYASFRSSPNSPPVFTGNKGLEGHGSAEWNQVGLWEHRDTDMVKVFLSDLQKAETTGVWPQFIVMHLGEDHTQGLDAKAFTPVAHVASNDQALGRIVEGLSHSRFWKDTAVLVIEDDAQDGPDHVDCHRTVALAISPYARRATVDHTHYSTTSLVRSIELMLGLPAMTEFDAHAMPLYRAFTANPDLGTYACLPAQVDLMARNPSTGEGALESAQLDFSDVDRADPQKLNRILWNALKPGRPMPAPVRSWAVGR